MKLCVTSTGDKLDSQVDSRFGRCKFFIFYEDENNTPEIIQNQAENAAHGAGIQAAQMIIDNKPDAVITGNIGPNAGSILMYAGIKAYSATGKTVKKAIESYIQGKLKELKKPNVQGHFGSGKGNNK